MTVCALYDEIAVTKKNAGLYFYSKAVYDEIMIKIKCAVMVYALYVLSVINSSGKTILESNRI